MEVIDHHHLERTPSMSCSVTVETVGSCATLVTEHIHHKAPEVLDRQVAQLLYGKVATAIILLHPAFSITCQTPVLEGHNVSGFLINVYLRTRQWGIWQDELSLNPTILL